MLALLEGYPEELPDLGILRDSPLLASHKGCVRVPGPCSEAVPKTVPKSLNSPPELPPTPASFYLTGKHKYATTLPGLIF